MRMVTQQVQPSFSDHFCFLNSTDVVGTSGQVNPNRYSWIVFMKQTYIYLCMVITKIYQQMVAGGLAVNL